MAGRAGAADSRCAKHTFHGNSRKGDGQISTNFFTYSERVGKFNLLNSPDLQQDIFLSIILAVIAV